MTHHSRNRWIFVWAAIATVSMCDAAAPAYAQAGDKPLTTTDAPAIAKWRPKDGTYASPGKDFESQCGEFGDVIIELTTKRVSGNEWGCDVKKITDTAANAIRLDMICDDYNLAQSIYHKSADSIDTRFKEFMFLRKRDAKSIFVQKSYNGKLIGSRWPATYCSESAQQMYKEDSARDAAEAARKAEEERLSHSDHPKDGVYALAGADFEQRCSKFGDAVIELKKAAISFGADKCKIVEASDQPPDTVRMEVLCNPPLNNDGMMLKKIDETNVIYWRRENGHFVGPGQQISYCAPDIQRAHSKQSGK